MAWWHRVRTVLEQRQETKLTRLGKVDEEALEMNVENPRNWWADLVLRANLGACVKCRWIRGRVITLCRKSFVPPVHL